MSLAYKNFLNIGKFEFNLDIQRLKIIYFFGNSRVSFAGFFKYFFLDRPRIKEVTNKTVPYDIILDRDSQYLIAAWRMKID